MVKENRSHPRVAQGDYLLVYVEIGDGEHDDDLGGVLTQPRAKASHQNRGVLVTRGHDDRRCCSKIALDRASQSRQDEPRFALPYFTGPIETGVRESQLVLAQRS